MKVTYRTAPERLPVEAELLSAHGLGIQVIPTDLCSTLSTKFVVADVSKLLKSFAGGRWA